MTVKQRVGFVILINAKLYFKGLLCILLNTRQCLGKDLEVDYQRMLKKKITTGMTCVEI